MKVAIKEKRLPEETKHTMARKLVELRYICIV